MLARTGNTTRGKPTTTDREKPREKSVHSVGMGRGRGGNEGGLTKSKQLGQTVVGEISEHVTFNPVSDKHHVAKECHDTVTRGNHVDGTIDNSGHLSNRRVSHLDVNDKHLPAGRRRNRRNNITPSSLTPL